MKTTDQTDPPAISSRSASQRDVVARQYAIDNARGDNWKALPGFATVGFMELRDGVCRWPITAEDAAESSRYCGRRCAPEGSYCETHKAIASVPIRPRIAPHRRDASMPATGVA